MAQLAGTRKKKKLTELAYNEIKNAIILNQVNTGDLLSTNEIAKKLGISRTPVREAIGVLDSEGFLEMKNGVGAIVKGISLKELSDIFEVRNALEIASLRTSINRIPKEEIDELINDWQECQKSLDDNEESLKLIYELDSRTHSLIIDYCDNLYLKELLEGIMLKIRRIQYISVKALGDSRDTIKQHIDLLKSIKAGNLEKTIQLIKDHIENAVGYIVHSNITSL